MRLPGELSGLMAWATATAGGLAFFLFLSWRDRPLGSRVAESAPQAVRTSVPAAPAPVRPVQRTGEGQQARWLRADVQAARFADPTIDGRRPDVLGSDDQGR
jgi:hypothetical protein